MSISDMLSMTMNEVNAFIKGLVRKREQWLNDSLALNYNLAILVSQSVWGSDDFPDEPTKVNLVEPNKPETREQIMKRILKFQSKVHKEIVELKGGEQHG